MRPSGRAHLGGLGAVRAGVSADVIEHVQERQTVLVRVECRIRTSRKGTVAVGTRLSSGVRRTDVATCGYNLGMTVGIRELKNNLSRYVRKAEAGERVAVTAHGRVVAELVPPLSQSGKAPSSRFERLVASGVVEPASEKGDPTAGWPVLRLNPGLTRALIDEDRGEA